MSIKYLETYFTFDRDRMHNITMLTSLYTRLTSRGKPSWQPPKYPSFVPAVAVQYEAGANQGVMRVRECGRAAAELQTM